MPFQKGNKLGFKHGGTKTALHLTWMNLFRRCYKPTDKAFKYYGGRGIQVCARWHKSNPNGFLNFKSDMGERPPNHSIDRIDNDGHYMPSNCRWATRLQQTLNSRTPRGERGGKAILSDSDVVLIKSLRLGGLTTRAIYERINRKCSHSNVKLIVQGRRWNHIGVGCAFGATGKKSLESGASPSVQSVDSTVILTTDRIGSSLPEDVIRLRNGEVTLGAGVVESPPTPMSKFHGRSLSAIRGQRKRQSCNSLCRSR